MVQRVMMGSSHLKFSLRCFGVLKGNTHDLSDSDKTDL